MAYNENLAKELQVDIPLRSPQTKPATAPQKKIAKRTSTITRIEKLIMSAIILMLFGLAITCVSMEVNVFSTNRELQDVRNEITMKQDANIDLKQEISELSGYDRIYDIAGKAGLKLNESNVRTVSE
ncbi:cell division protein FtsL [Isobaculum melis]|uniref:Cell division protein FtsL n=1 Tax=Isobaculum melis TaxID=142588 RepID=A0A1H9T763_9LACT|nr:cell division protein FtsL [Isobaculum melis]SER92966.1 cell division protein FtsL [Isobaculum melis]